MTAGSRFRWQPAGLGLIVLVALAALKVECAAADLYQWIDGEGVEHYTAALDSIPIPHREAARPLRHPMARAAPEPSGPDARSVPDDTAAAGASPGSGLEVLLVPGAPVIVPAELNGVALSLVIDTGADRTMLAPDALVRAGLGGERGRAVELIGVTGSAGAVVLVVPRLDIAGSRVGPVEVVAYPSPVAGTDGLLGRDVLDGFVLTVDTGAGRATLAPR
jgi:aspartyl protease